MTATPAQMFEREFFSALEYEFAKMLGRRGNETDPAVLLGSALALRQAGLGHVCCDLTLLGGRKVTLASGDVLDDLAWPDFDTWRGALLNSPLVSTGDDVRPLVLDEKGRLYLHRLFQKEKELAKLLLDRAAASPEPIDEDLFNRDATALLGGSTDDADGRHAAARQAVQGRLTVITGGPGAGKTTLVLAILLLITRQFQAVRGTLPKIEMVAPTGKAARRLAQTVKQATRASVEKLGPGGLSAKASLPENAATIHRLLGQVRLRHRRTAGSSAKKLGADILVADEASMVDLLLMHELMSAAGPDTKVIIVGDKDQLASVESGAVTADIFDAARANEKSDLARATVRLTGSYRFGKDGGIGRLARAVNDGDSEAALHILKNDPSGQVDYIPTVDANKMEHILRVAVQSFFEEIFKTQDPARMLDALGRFRVLTPYRTGPFGQLDLNLKIENFLARRGMISSSNRWYIGRPVMVTQNDYTEQLFNGDTGIIARDAQRNRPVAAFEDQGGLRLFSPERLSTVETVYAVTVHKSQGSEFDNVFLAMPDRISPVAVRELLYTAITRARKKLTLIGSETFFLHAASSPTQRASGLKDRLLSNAKPL